MLPQPSDTSLITLGRSDRWLITLACVLLFIWPLPGTMALRLLIIVVLLGLAAWRCRQPGAGIGEVLRMHRKLLITYGVLTTWIVVEALLFADDKAVTMQEISSQWIRSGITGLIGFLVAALVARRLPHQGGPQLALALTLAVALQVGLQELDTFWRWLVDGVFPFQQTRLFANRTQPSLVINLLMGLLSAEAMARLLHHKRYMPIPSSWLILLIALCFFATYALGTRYGTIGFLALMTSCVVVVLIAKRHEINLFLLLAMAVVLLGGISAFGWSAVKSDPRWLTLAQTIPVALDTEHQQAWRNLALPMPPIADGSPAEESAYLRIAFAKEAVLAVLRNPFGIGFGRNAFGDAMLRIHPDYASMKNSHSGVLNFTIGVGVPGLLLWLAFIGILMAKGWRSFFHNKNPAGLLLMFVVSGFFTRSVVDSNFQDHMFEQFMFLAMLFNVLAGENERSA